MAQENTSPQEVYEAFDAVFSANDADTQAEAAHLQAIAEMQEEWFSRTPEENVELLNQDSSQTGVHGFSYVDTLVVPEGIPGMNVVEYSLPNDPNGGKYVGYESYEQTFQRATEEYQNSFIDGQTTDEAEAKYQAASELYDNQKQAYEGYLRYNPSCPDYLNSDNPVQAYRDYEIPRREAEALDRREAWDAETDISMEEAISELGDDRGTTSVHTNAYYSAMSDEEGLTANEEEMYKPDEYIVRQAGTINDNVIQGMQKYVNSADISVPEVTAEVGTDDYGRQVVAQLQAIDEDLVSRDANYKSQFPADLRYLAEGENPPAIPGMTVVIGKIEGAPGYYAGYETYDTTYSRAMATVDAEAQAIEEAYEDPNADVAALTARSEANDALSESASDNYDYQKNQYEQYVQKHPGNDFLMKANPSYAYASYTNAFDKGIVRDFIANAKDYLSDGLTKGYENLQGFGKRVQALFEGKLTFEQFFNGDAIPNQYTEAQAAAVSAEYWSRRAELESDNPDIQAKAAEAQETAAQYKTEETEASAQEGTEADGLTSIRDGQTQAEGEEVDGVSGAAPTGDGFTQETEEPTEEADTTQTTVSSEETVQEGQTSAEQESSGQSGSSTSAVEDDDVITADSAYETGSNPVLAQNAAGGYQVLPNGDTWQIPMANPTMDKVFVSRTGNAFRDILNQTRNQDSYTYQHAPAWNSYLSTVDPSVAANRPAMPQGSTGFSMLDEMNQGGTASVDRLMNQLPSDSINAKQTGVDRGQTSRPLPVSQHDEPAVDRQNRPLPSIAQIASKPSQASRQNASGGRGDIQARLEALAGKLEQNSVQHDGPTLALE